MARLRGVITVDPVIGPGGGRVWLLQGIAAANQPVKVSEPYLGTDNTGDTTSLLEIFRATSPGSGGTTVTPATIDEDDTESWRSTWSAFLTTAPTGLTLIRNVYIHPRLSWPDWSSGPIAIKGGGILAIAYTPAVTSSIKLTLKIEE